MKIMERKKENLITKILANPQRLLVALCLFAVCVGTQQIQTVAWNTGLIEFSRDSLGFLMAIIIMTNYHWNDIKAHKLPYLVWSILGGILLLILIPAAISKRLDFLAADTVMIGLGVFFMGYCIIHTCISFFVEKYRPDFYLPLFILWVVMLLLMIFSKSDYLWPECYFVLFLCYYLTRQTPVQRQNTIYGVIDGIILGFLAIQAHSLLFRPYDRVAYYGNFCNPNHNSMFLCMCLAAILAKLLILTRERSNKWMKIFFYLLAGGCYSFIFMTICRSGYLATFVLTIFFLICYCKITGKKVFFRMGFLLVGIFLAIMPVTYLAVRYLPTIHPHVLFYFQEGYSEEERVHSWDERNSEKYVSFSELLGGIFGKMEALRSSSDDSVSSKTENGDTGTFLSEETDPDKIPALEYEDGSNAILVRYTIYKWFFTHLSLRGMPYDEQGFQLTADHWIQDTHDIYLDYGINFGYPVMILFLIFIWWGIGRLTRQGVSARNTEKIACLLIALVPPVFGLFEFAWGAGMLSTVAFYLVFKEMFERS